MFQSLHEFWTLNFFIIFFIFLKKENQKFQQRTNHLRVQMALIFPAAALPICRVWGCLHDQTTAARCPHLKEPGTVNWKRRGATDGQDIAAQLLFPWRFFLRWNSSSSRTFKKKS